MPFPRMSVFEKHFTYLDDVPVSASKNPVKKVSFVDSLGNTVIGFFKAKSEDYTPFQIKYAVASSILVRLFVGEQGAEERLVFNEKGDIIGSVSIWCPDYKPMKAWKLFWQSVTDVEEKKIVNPSTSDLLVLNFMRLLMAATRIKGDDFHGGNLCPTAMIDAERYAYHILAEVLGYRWNEGRLHEEPIEALRFRSEHLSNYPNDGRCTHWPANDIPKCITIEKIHAAAEAVQSLASNPCIETENGQVCANDQKFTAVLAILLAFNSNLLQAHLEPYLGDLPLDFMSLNHDSGNKEAANRLMGKFPHLFNKETDKDSFIKHYCVMQQIEHDEFYRANVFYWGCKENKYHVPVPGFWEFLKNRPGAFREVTAWMEAQNKAFEAVWEKQQFSSTEPSLSSNPSSTNCMGPECQYDLKMVEAAYHQIYRDSRSPLIYDCLMELNASYSKLLARESELPFHHLNLEDDELTSVHQIFGKLIIPKPPDANLLHLNIYTLLQGLNKAIQAYTDLKGKDLTKQANEDFLETYKRQLAIYLEEIESQNPPEQWYLKFRQLVSILEFVCEDFSFEKHLNSENASINVPINIISPKFLTRENTNKKVVSAGIKTLFEWAKTVERSLLIDLLLNILHQYEPHPLNVLSNRKRHLTIEKYLKSTEDDGPNILAYILSTGAMKSNSLNCKMVDALLNYMVYQYLDVKDLSLFTIRDALEKKEFDIEVYTREAIHYASSMNEAITNKHSNFTIKKFYDEMYDWAEKQDKDMFTQLLNKSIDAHRSYFSLGFFASNSLIHQAAELVQSNYSQSEKLACLFYETANDPMGKTLLDNVLEAMNKTECQEYPCVNNYNKMEDEELYFKRLSQFSSLHLNIDDETLARFAHALFYFTDSLNKEKFQSLLKEAGAQQDGQEEKVANSYQLARLLKKENEKICELICIKLRNEIITSFATSKTRVDATHFKRILNFNMALQGRYFIRRREDFANLRLKPQFTPKELIKKIFNYVEHTTPTCFNALIENSIAVYEQNISCYTTPRSGAVREVLGKQISNKEKLAQIFKAGGIDSTSLNTHIFRRLTQELQCSLEAEDEVSYLKDLRLLAEKQLQTIVREKTRILSLQSEVKFNEEDGEFNDELVFHCV